MEEFPKEVEQIILNFLKERYLRKKGIGVRSSFNEKDLRYFSKGAEKLSKAFTEDRDYLLPNYLRDPALYSGYLLYFLPINFLKIIRILKQLSYNKPPSPLRILDVGSGPGTSMLGIMAHHADLQTPLQFTLIDQNRTALRDAIYFHDEYRAVLKKKHPQFNSSCAIFEHDLRRGAKGIRGKYDFVILCNVLNELSNRDQQIGLVENLFKENLEHDGRMILIEPATRKASRDLQHLRDEIAVQKKMAYVHAPCLHQKICPLNVINQRDWCHFYFSWERPAFIEKVDRLIGNKKNWLQCSYLVLGNKLIQFNENSWRVISNVMPTRGKKEVVLCGHQGRYHLTRLDRNQSLNNRAMDEIRRGDIVEIEINQDSNQYSLDGKYQVMKEDKLKSPS